MPFGRIFGFTKEKNCNLFPHVCNSFSGKRQFSLPMFR